MLLSDTFQCIPGKDFIARRCRHGVQTVQIYGLVSGQEARSKPYGRKGQTLYEQGALHEICKLSVEMAGDKCSVR
jgi:hypothetical protein